MNLWALRGPCISARPQYPDLDLPCDLDGVIDFHPWMANCTLQLGAGEQQLHRAQISRALVLGLVMAAVFRIRARKACLPS